MLGSRGVHQTQIRSRSKMLGNCCLKVCHWVLKKEMNLNWIAGNPPRRWRNHSRPRPPLLPPPPHRTIPKQSDVTAKCWPRASTTRLATAGTTQCRLWPRTWPPTVALPWPTQGVSPCQASPLKCRVWPPIGRNLSNWALPTTNCYFFQGRPVCGTVDPGPKKAHAPLEPARPRPHPEAPPKPVGGARLVVMAMRHVAPAAFPPGTKTGGVPGHKVFLLKTETTRTRKASKIKLRSDFAAREEGGLRACEKVKGHQRLTQTSAAAPFPEMTRACRNALLIAPRRRLLWLSLYYVMLNDVRTTWQLINAALVISWYVIVLRAYTVFTTECANISRWQINSYYLIKCVFAKMTQRRW